jgi:hypothetical protein
MLAFFLVELALQAWPPAFLQPAWLDQMSGLLVSRGITPLTGALLLAAAPVVGPHSDRLANPARLVRRFARWVAIGYLLLIPVQLHAGVKLLQEQKQQARQVFEQASGSTRAIRGATSEAELRQAYEQIPGPKPPLPAPLPGPLSLVKERLLPALEARNNSVEHDVNQRLNVLWNQAVELLFGNILRALVLAGGFAAIGRRSPAHPTLLTSLLSWKRGLRGRSGRQRRSPLRGGVRRPWAGASQRNKPRGGASPTPGDGR